MIACFKRSMKSQVSEKKKKKGSLPLKLDLTTLYLTQLYSICILFILLYIVFYSIVYIYVQYPILIRFQCFIFCYVTFHCNKTNFPPMGLKVILSQFQPTATSSTPPKLKDRFSPSRHKKKQLRFGFLSVILFNLKYEDADW